MAKKQPKTQVELEKEKQILDKAISIVNDPVYSLNEARALKYGPNHTYRHISEEMIDKRYQDISSLVIAELSSAYPVKDRYKLPLIDKNGEYLKGKTFEMKIDKLSISPLEIYVQIAEDKSVKKAYKESIAKSLKLL